MGLGVGAVRLQLAHRNTDQVAVEASRSLDVDDAKLDLDEPGEHRRRNLSVGRSRHIARGRGGPAASRAIVWASRRSSREESAAGALSPPAPALASFVDDLAGSYCPAVRELRACRPHPRPMMLDAMGLAVGRGQTCWREPS